MTHYEKLIVESVGCSLEEAQELEDIMRDCICSSNLGEMSGEAIRLAARQALAFKQGMEVASLDF